MSAQHLPPHGGRVGGGQSEDWEIAVHSGSLNRLRGCEGCHPVTPKFPTLGFTKLLRETALGATVRSKEATSRPILPSTGGATLELRPGGPW